MLDDIDLPPGVEDAPLSQPRIREVMHLFAALAERRMEALRIFEPLPQQKAFLGSKCRQRIAYGSNRATKTTACAVDCARIVTGQDPHKRCPEKNGICYIVARDGRALATVIYKKLFDRESFKMIRDEVTGRWRAFRPYMPGDKAREDEAKWAPPLIPERMVKKIAWFSKKERIPKLVILTNGWELHFFSGNAKAPKGVAVSLAWFDEEIPDTGWFAEIQARLLDRRGHFMWSATPEEGTDELLRLHERAEEEFDKCMDAGTEPAIEEFFFLLEHNPHISDKDKQDFADSLTDEQKRVKVHGEFLQLGATCLPEFGDMHVCQPFLIPANWTRFAYIDPGYDTTAVLFMAVPDPYDKAHAPYRYFYDELYLRQCNPDMFGYHMKHRCEGQDFHAFLIDGHEAVKHYPTSPKSVIDIFSDALKEHGVRSRTTGHGFIFGSDDPKADVAAIRLWLRDRLDTGPTLKVFPKEIMPKFHQEIRHWRRKKEPGTGRILDEPESRGQVHLMAGLRGLVQHNPQWIKSRPSTAVDPIWRLLEEDRKREQALHGDEPAAFCGPRGMLGA